MHIPVMLEEVLETLQVVPGGKYIDATLGGGGYVKAILRNSDPDGAVLALEWDEEAIGRIEKEINTLGLENWIFANANATYGYRAKGAKKRSPETLEADLPSEEGGRFEAGSFLGADGENRRKEKLEPYRSGPAPATSGRPAIAGMSAHAGKAAEKRLVLKQSNFAKLERAAREENFTDIDGVVFDLGLSTDTLEISGRGFSHQSGAEPLLMTFSRDQALSGGKTARRILNTWTEEEIANVIREFGEEAKGARAIARSVVARRKTHQFDTVHDLVDAVKGATGSASPKLLSRVFQSFRIVVNDELGNLSKGLEGAWDVTKVGGAIVVLSYHSLEDRIVKNFFRDKVHAGLARAITKKALTATEREVNKNKRSRSAKLRAISKLS